MPLRSSIWLKSLAKDSNGRVFILVIGYFLVWSRKIVFKLWLVNITVLSGRIALLLRISRFSNTKEVRIPSSMRAEIVLILFSITFLLSTRAILLYNRCSRNISEMKFDLNGLKYKIFFKKTLELQPILPCPHLQFNWQWTYVIWFSSNGCSLAFNHNGCFSVGMLYSNY